MAPIVCSCRYVLEKDPYYVCDYVVTWFGGKLSERQEMIKKKNLRTKLLTPYAAKLFHRQEVMDRKQNLSCMSGSGSSFTQHRKGLSGTMWILKIKPVTVGGGRPPPYPALDVVDKLNMCDTVPKRLQFREDWIKKYF